MSLRSLLRWLLVLTIASQISPGTVAASGSDFSTGPIGYNGLVGSTVIQLDFDFDAGNPTTVTIGHFDRNVRFPGSTRLVVGDRGALIEQMNGTVTFLPSHSFTMMEFLDANARATVESLRTRALWGRTWPEPEPNGRLGNFWYTVGDVTHGIWANEVLVTPDELVILSHGGIRLQIVAYSAVSRLEIR